VPATYNPDIMVCPREADANSYGDFQTTGPVIFPRDTTQDGWVGFANQVYWWNGSKWVYWLTTTPLFHFKPSNIFEQAFETRDWYDAKLQPSSGVWNYHGPKNIYYAVVTVLYWAPQPSYPYATTTAVLAHQDPLATNSERHDLPAGRRLTGREGSSISRALRIILACTTTASQR